MLDLYSTLNVSLATKAAPAGHCGMRLKSTQMSMRFPGGRLAAHRRACTHNHGNTKLATDTHTLPKNATAAPCLLLQGKHTDEPAAGAAPPKQ